ncbi:IclR family transcriptional regulator [Streptomyces sp. SAJ15]|uniref:IclR family transcriptional regulator n=1 Tax=Streptomyces sp. SAJ15 TaxID=2011095 RepID=UPI001184C849|nr:IclR family transcriptional regulator C-terminal domain-containing protein [Streptomyces sp. SAJ15]TVL93049.1 IclR family transcriptional regulator [Streptomyces sp. SAJ15]
MVSRGAVGGTGHAERVFRVQRAFTWLRGRAHGPGELARATGLDDSTVYRILRSGVGEGAFVQEGRGLYRLGSTTPHLALKALAHAPVRDACHAALEDLREATEGGLAFLYLLAPFGGAGRQCVDMAVGDSDLTELGLSPRALLAVSQSLRVGAAGRAILAHLPEAIREAVLEQPVPPEAGPGAHRDDVELLASLKPIREQGYALEREESAAGWHGCAAPVHADELIMGSVLLLKPAHALPAEISRDVIAATRRAADGIRINSR